MTPEGLDGTGWDAIVVGAGPAGSLAARGLAKAGARTLLVERSAFPRWKVCGACLNGHALASLHDARLGTLAPRQGAVPLDRFELHFRGKTAHLPLPDGVSLSRSRFDAALADAAAEAGASVAFENQAHIEEIDEGSRAVRLVHRGRSARITARVVLDAAGLGGACLSSESITRTRVAAGSRVGAGCVVSDVPAAYSPGTIFMATGRHGYVGLVRVEDQSLNVAAAFATDFVRSHGSPGRAAAAILDEAGALAVPGLESADWRGTPALTRRTRPLGDDRLFVLGDAAGYVEPFTGEGMAWALASGLAIVPLALRAIDGWTPGLVREWSALHRRLVGRRQVVCRAVAMALRRPWLTPVVFETLARWPGVSSCVLRRLNAPSSPRLS
jgi:flavin-dependent dehydrogenase